MKQVDGAKGTNQGTNTESKRTVTNHQAGIKPIPDALRRDTNILNAVLASTPEQKLKTPATNPPVGLKLVSERLKKDPDIVKAAVESNPGDFVDLFLLITDTKQVVEKGFKHGGYDIKFNTDNLTQDDLANLGIRFSYVKRDPKNQKVLSMTFSEFELYNTYGIAKNKFYTRVYKIGDKGELKNLSFDAVAGMYQLLSLPFDTDTAKIQFSKVEKDKIFGTYFVLTITDKPDANGKVKTSSIYLYRVMPGTR